MKKSAPEVSRREFLGSACCAAVGATGLLSTLGSLRLMGAAASPDNGPQIPARAGAIASDYKALVCLFLNGGNDANNLIVPLGSGTASDAASYSAYAAARTNLALPKDRLLAITPRSSDGRTWGLHPSLAEFHGLFTAGQGALLANAGTLVYPTTKTQYNNRTVPLPPQLFSHSDQQVQWQHSVPDKPTTTGWGGRMADLLNAFNTDDKISMSISIAGKNTFQVGSQVTQYAIGTGGAPTLTGTTTSATPTTPDGIRFRAQKDLFGQQQNSLIEAAFGGASSDAIVSSELLNTVLSASGTLATTFPNTTAGNQLKMAARLIKAAPSLGLKRQVFFVQLGGWDLHAGQLVNSDPTTGTHAGLIAQVSQALKAFYDATIELGVANQVTTFTASDFGRTFRSNGDGSDHGWGSHHLIVGGAVRGNTIYGSMPTLAINGPDDTGLGRWIPTTSVDEYAATLARWFGVSASDLPIVLPNIGRFARPNLGILG
jgi:uncharacterized protein (DUF1501 family)